MYEEGRNPFFEVKRENLVTESGLHTGKQAIINSETSDVLGIVSPNYELVTNDDVNSFFENALYDMNINVVKNIDHMDSITRRWKRWMILDTVDLQFNVGTSSDQISIMIEIFNGYNAKTSFGYRVMGYRWYCENGQIAGREDLFSGSFAHFIDNPERLQDSFNLKFNNFKAVALIWNKWANEPFNKEKWEHFINFYKKDPDNKQKHQFLPKKLAENMIEDYEDILVEQQLPDTKWGAYNVLTYLATHKTKARKGSNVFSNGYGNLVRLTNHFYMENPVDVRMIES
jgi:hypothetical protein